MADSRDRIPKARILLYGSPLASPGGVGRFFYGRPFGEGAKFANLLELIIFYNDGRFGADVAPPFVALNMVRPATIFGENQMVLKGPR